MRYLQLLLLLCIATVALGQPPVDKQIQAVLTDIENFNHREWIIDSSNARLLRLHTEEAFSKKYNFYKATNTRLNQINKDLLSFEDQINLELLLHGIRDTISIYEYKAYLNPLLSDYGFHTTLPSRAKTTFIKREDVRNYINLLRDIPRFVSENLQLMRRGLMLGISQPMIIIIGLKASYETHLVDTLEKSIFWKPFIKKPISVTEAEWLSMQAEAKEAIRNDVIPSFQKIKSFLESEYPVSARKTLGASAFPNGTAFYENTSPEPAMKNTYLFIKRDAENFAVRAASANGVKDARVKAKADNTWELVSFSKDVASYTAHTSR